MQRINVNVSNSPEHIEKKEGRGTLRSFIRYVIAVKVPAIVLLIKELDGIQKHLYPMLRIVAHLDQREGSGRISIALTKG
jgi:hypothetical protein